MEEDSTFKPNKNKREEASMTKKERLKYIASQYDKGAKRFKSSYDDMAIHCGVSAVTIYRDVKLLGLSTGKKPVVKHSDDKPSMQDIVQMVERDPEYDEEHHAPKAPKKGIEDKYGDGSVVINWTTRFVHTDLGEYGTYNCSFGKHQRIQRAYSDMYEGKGENQAELAMRFDFPHTRAVSRYLKLHGIRHSSLPQTDLEFEEGLEADEAVEENIQSLKRAAHKKTQQRLWREIQGDADKWRHFDEHVLLPLRDDIQHAPKYRVRKLVLPKGREPFLVVNGLTDWHFSKFAFDPYGKQTYGVEQAREVLQATSEKLIARVLRHGKPERSVLIIGSDNFHVDNPHKTTTRGTPQDVEGEYEVLIKPYIEAVINNIELHRQVAPVQLVVVPGNHDYITSLWLGHLLKYRYEDAKDVEVVLRTHPRIYIQYGNYCLGFTHGEEFGSMAKVERNIHKLFLSEAKEQGVNLAEIIHFYMFSGHRHYDESRDFGVVNFHIMPSLCGDDRWHKKQMFIGTRKQTKAYLISPADGLFTDVYASYEVKTR